MHFRSEKTKKALTSMPVQDAGYKRLIKLSKQTPGFVKRSKTQILSYYQGTTKEGLVRFMTPSGTMPGVYYRQNVQLVDLDKLIKKHKDKKKPQEIVKLAVQGNLKVTCNDPAGNDEPSWIYWGFKYLATEKNYLYKGNETRFPEIRNPKLKGSLCKHLIQVLSNLPFHIQVIARDLVKQERFVPDD